MTDPTPIAPTDLRDFLRSLGWTQRDEAMRHRLYALSHDSYAQRQLVFPMDTTVSDYAQSVDMVLGKLSELMCLDRATLLERVSYFRDDVIRLRVFHDAHDHHVPMGFASGLIASVEKMLKSVACTVLRPRIHHPKLSLSEASELIEKSRFGQTERGSYVVKVACPLNALYLPGDFDLFDSAAPFVRKVTLTLNESLRQLTQAIEADSIERLLENTRGSETPILSSNLCEAVASMHDELLNNSLSVNFDWSSLRQPPASVNTDPIVIQRDYFSRIEAIGQELRSAEREQTGTFIGTVEELEGDFADDGRRSGPVVLAVLMPESGESIRVRTVLNADQYALAHQAHAINGSYLRLMGRLMPGQKIRRLIELSQFEIVGG